MPALRSRPGEALIDHCVDDALGLYDQVGPGHPALKLLVDAQRSDLLRTAPQEREALQVAAVRPQQNDLEILDLAVALQSAPVLNALIEDLDRALLASTHDLTPTDEQCCVSHSPLLSLGGQEQRFLAPSQVPTPVDACQRP
jgi:hypothetical protein